MGIVIGLTLSGIMVLDGLQSVVRHRYCLVLSDDFSQGFRSELWTKEMQLGGFGNGEFEHTTADDENVFVRDDNLWIMPTLQDASLFELNSIIKLSINGNRTSNLWKDCVAATNNTAQSNCATHTIRPHQHQKERHKQVWPCRGHSSTPRVRLALPSDLDATCRKYSRRMAGVRGD